MANKNFEKAKLIFTVISNKKIQNKKGDRTI